MLLLLVPGNNSGAVLDTSVVTMPTTLTAGKWIVWERLPRMPMVPTAEAATECSTLPTLSFNNVTPHTRATHSKRTISFWVGADAVKVTVRVIFCGAASRVSRDGCNLSLSLSFS
jgi:hypothetical protein